MKREDLLEKGYTEEQVSELLDMFHKNSSSLSKQVEDLQTQLDSEKNKVAGLTKIESEYNAMKAEQLSEDEKQALAKKEIESNLKKSREILNTAKAKEILAELGEISESVIARMVTDNEDETIKNATALRDMIKADRELTSNKTKQELASVDIKPTPSNNLDQDTMTWEKFDKMSADEQVEYADQHPDEFANLQ